MGHRLRARIAVPPNDVPDPTCSRRFQQRTPVPSRSWKAPLPNATGGDTYVPSFASSAGMASTGSAVTLVSTSAAPDCRAHGNLGFEVTEVTSID